MRRLIVHEKGDCGCYAAWLNSQLRILTMMMMTMARVWWVYVMELCVVCPFLIVLSTPLHNPWKYLAVTVSYCCNMYLHANIFPTFIRKNLLLHVCTYISINECYALKLQGGYYAYGSIVVQSLILHRSYF